MLERLVDHGVGPRGAVPGILVVADGEVNGSVASSPVAPIVQLLPLLMFELPSRLPGWVWVLSCRIPCICERYMNVSVFRRVGRNRESRRGGSFAPPARHGMTRSMAHSLGGADDNKFTERTPDAVPTPPLPAGPPAPGAYARESRCSSRVRSTARGETATNTAGALRQPHRLTF